MPAAGSIFPFTCIVKCRLSLGHFHSTCVAVLTQLFSQAYNTFITLCLSLVIDRIVDAIQFDIPSFCRYHALLGVLSFVMFMGNNFYSHLVTFGICHVVVFSHKRVYFLYPTKKILAMTNLWMLTFFASQIQNANLLLHLHSAIMFFNITLLDEN